MRVFFEVSQSYRCFAWSIGPRSKTSNEMDKTSFSFPTVPSTSERKAGRACRSARSVAARLLYMFKKTTSRALPRPPQVRPLGSRLQGGIPRHGVGKFRCTFTAKFYRVLRLIEHCYEQNAIDKGKLLEQKVGGRVANTCHRILKRIIALNY